MPTYNKRSSIGLATLQSIELVNKINMWIVVWYVYVDNNDMKEIKYAQKLVLLEKSTEFIPSWERLEFFYHLISEILCFSRSFTLDWRWMALLVLNYLYIRTQCIDYAVLWILRILYFWLEFCFLWKN